MIGDWEGCKMLLHLFGYLDEHNGIQSTNIFLGTFESRPCHGNISNKNATFARKMSKNNVLHQHLLQDKFSGSLPHNISEDRLFMTEPPNLISDYLSNRVRSIFVWEKSNISSKERYNFIV